MGLWGPWGPRGRARRARRPFSSDVPHRLEQPTPPYEPYYVPHGPHGARRVVLAGREARADPGGAPARARPSRRPSERCTSCPSYPPCTARAGALRVPGEGVGACVLRGALHRATRGLQGLQGLRTVWGSEVPGAPEIFLFYFFQFEKNKKICLSLPLFSKKECKVCKVCSTLFTTPPPPPPRAPPWPYHSGPTWRSRARPP